MRSSSARPLVRSLFFSMSFSDCTPSTSARRPACSIMYLSKCHAVEYDESARMLSMRGSALRATPCRRGVEFGVILHTRPVLSTTSKQVPDTINARQTNEGPSVISCTMTRVAGSMKLMHPFVSTVLVLPLENMSTKLALRRSGPTSVMLMMRPDKTGPARMSEPFKKTISPRSFPIQISSPCECRQVIVPPSELSMDRNDS
mmetsp:Transcript_15801/g.40438  ORF Transcript_15801/g.40438 Transcript_15801/m.40438 type:complete len:202 (-) Transcript_15801:1175-1780(-)